MCAADLFALVLAEPQAVDADVAERVEVLHGVDELQQCRPRRPVRGRRDEGQVVVQLLDVLEVLGVVFLRAFRHVRQEILTPFL